ncbi:MAG: 2-dehydropantoate 2-reductase, partial [Pseudomonadales bacterium]|nr:2-dehydropantoate 2-reductase [Pseudomonadales bacterium]
MYRVLVVGAGAVGQVYGHFMQRGGASVSFFVKEKYQSRCEEGFSLYRCRRSGLGGEEHYQADAVYTQYEEIAKQKFDHIWLAMPSNDLEGAWLGELKEAIGDTTLVMLQPDLEDRDYVLKYFPESQLVYGMINFISYQTPLPDLPSHHPDVDKVGVAYL